jgi:hypothetical protein
MNRCEEYELELSAMLDGESDPATAVVLMDHLCGCSSCREFYGKLRSFQALVDDISPAVDDQPAPETIAPAAGVGQRSGWFGWLGGTPRWAMGAAAVVVVAIGIWAVAGAGIFDRFGGEKGLFEGGSVTIELEGDALSVDDERFIELASAILSADRRYQHQMYVILDEVQQNTQPGESPFDGEVVDNEERGEYSGDAFAHIGSRRVLD